MKHNFLKKLTALLLGTIMVFSMIPAIAVSTKAADVTTVSVVIADYADANGWSNNEPYTSVVLDSYITATAVGGGNTGKYYTTGESWRFYQTSSSQLTVSASDGVTIVSVKVTYSVSNDGVLTYNGVQYGTDETIAVNAATATFGVGNTGTNTNGQVRISAIEVSYSICEHQNTTVIGEAKEVSCTEDGITAGERCSDCGKVLVEQETIEATGHNFVGNSCSKCGAGIPTFKKVTSTLDDFTGTYLIVYEADKVAFNGQNVVDGDNNTVGVELEDGVITGDYLANTFTITNDGTNYIIQSASGKYIGRTTDSNGLNISDTKKYTHSNISIDESGNAVITSSGGFVLQFNADSDEKRFRYYGGTQKDIALYKLVEVTEPEQPEDPEIPEPDPNAPVFTGFGLTLNKGVTVRVNFNVTAEWLAANPTAKAVFSNNEECDVIVGENTFTTTLTPGKIGSDLTVTLGDVTETVSVSAYIEKAKAAYPTDTNLCTLLDAIDVYGKAAAKVEQSLTAPDFNAIAGYVVTDNTVITGFTNTILDEYATIGLNINAKDGYTFVASRGPATTGKLLLADHLENGVLYIENIRPANFGDVITVTIYDGDTVVSTINFTFNSYLKLAYGKATTDLDRNIVIAAYNYGVAAAAYVGA